MVMISAWNNTSSEFKARIIGKLLGDGGITKQEGRKPRLKFTHAAKDYEWINYCYKKLKTDIPINPPIFKKVIDDRLVNGYSLAYYVQSKTSDTISFLYNKWYQNGVKVIPFSLLNKHFTCESLAWWYMDDGHLKIENNIPKKVILSIESFTDNEIFKLIDFMKETFKLLFSIDGQNRMILYDQYQIHYFLNLIYPYLHHSMYRKFILKSILNEIITSSRRTTIYLPDKIHFTQPTKEINNALRILSKVIDDYKKGNFYSKYHNIIKQDCKKRLNKNYQIVIEQQNLRNLAFLKQNTGLNYSQLTELCFNNFVIS